MSKFAIKSFLLGAGSMVMLSSAALAQDAILEAEPESTVEAEEVTNDVPRKLDKVTVRGVRGAPAPKTGRVLLSVGITPGTKHRNVFVTSGARRRAENTSITASRYGLSFARIDFEENGDASLVPPSSDKRFFRITGDFNGTETFSLNLPEGYYALSEVRLDTGGFDSPTNDITSPVSSSLIPGGASIYRSREDFCIAQKTFVFEVVNGQTSYLGDIVLNDLNGNRSKYKTHIPLAGFSQSVEKINQDEKWTRAIETEIFGTPVRKIAFNADEPICRIKGSKSVLGWESVQAENSES